MRGMKRHLLLTAVGASAIVVLLWAGALRPQAAGQAPPPAFAPGTESGFATFQTQCAQCHGTNGNGRGFDDLSGESASELYDELTEMKYRTRIESIMDRQARGYTDAQLRAIADYFASQPGGGH